MLRTMLWTMIFGSFAASSCACSDTKTTRIDENVSFRDLDGWVWIVDSNDTILVSANVVELGFIRGAGYIGKRYIELEYEYARDAPCEWFFISYDSLQVIRCHSLNELSRAVATQAAAFRYHVLPVKQKNGYRVVFDVRAFNALKREKH
jgi:hypothetical protein